jgi:hypothetical protein
MTDDELIDCLIRTGEAVEYGEPWTETTTHEWWRDSTGQRHVRLVMTYHGGGNRGDDDEAEYVRRLLDTGRAVSAELVHKHTSSGSSDPLQLPRQITHVIENGKARRIRYYMPPPEGVNPDGSGQ